MNGRRAIAGAPSPFLLVAQLREITPSGSN
jgi:hypothetical protein